MQIKSSKKISLLDLLQELSPDSSRNTLRGWIEAGRVVIDGNPAKQSNQIVEKDQQIIVSAKPKFLKSELKILYEDNDLVVVDKPAGLLSVATDLEKERNVHALLKRRFHNRMVYPIHRLDQETSGLLVFAYTKKARDHLKQQLEQRKMQREYYALVHGHPGQGIWRCFLYEDKWMRVHVTKKGREAITYFETMKRKGAYSLLKLKLQSGRKHQIRVQAAHFGFPIVGDSKYGIPEDAGKSLQLRAVALSFQHPKNPSRILTFRSGNTQGS